MKTFNKENDQISSTQDYIVRQSDLTLELIMQPSASLGASVDIFTGVIPFYCLPMLFIISSSFINSSIGPISNFDWDQGSDDAPIQDDPALEDYNVQEVIDMFVEECIEQSQDYRTVRICTWHRLHVLLSYIKIL
jgi:hypothetical protein